MPAETKWNLSGDYFESCNCNVVCPCLISPAPQLTSQPTEGDCHFAAFFHIDKGAYGGVKLDGLNVVFAAESHGPMADGNWTNAAYVDERADERQTEALGAIFGGGAGGPIAALAPLYGKSLGVKKAPITYAIDGKTRRGEIAGVIKMSASPLPTMSESGEMFAETGHPFNPTRLALAVGGAGNTYADHGLKWDNSGKNAHYAAINWSN